MLEGFMNRITARFMAKDPHPLWTRRKIMLNIFADALLIATRLGHLPEDSLQRPTKRRSPREFQDIEGLRVGDSLRAQGR
jgi:hypothetical protein